MSNPKNKAIELVNSCNELAKDFTRGVSMNEFSKQFALLMVEEIIRATWKTIRVREKVTYSMTGYDDVVRIKYDKYWLDVKLEIEKL